MNHLPMRLTVTMILLALCSTGVQAQHLWQEPPPPQSRAQIEKFIGPIEQDDPSRDIHIVWVWGDDPHHDIGFHEYGWVKDLFRKLFRGVERVSFDDAKLWPSPQQWERADLVVFYLHLDPMDASRYAQLDAHLAKGGGMVALHESVILRPKGDELAKRFGLAWDEGQSEWGVLPLPVTIHTELNHPVFEGFSNTHDFIDEFYWRLTGDTSQLAVLGTAQAWRNGDTPRPPRPDELDGKAWPVFWSMDTGKGRVFSTVVGHNYFIFNDPYFRIVLLRAMAWTLHESFDPFKPLVFDGVEMTP